ncbi:hypothetical protein GF407_05795 [candidate division KSB1 bacterium]|nr:hypothetical protein [candidate division KSB1 bacterium]
MILIFLVLVLTLAQFRIIYRLNGGRNKIEGFGYNEKNLLNRETNIQAWMNRILAPVLVLGFSKMSGLAWHSSHLFLSVLLLFLLNIMLFYYCLKLCRSPGTAACILLSYLLAFLLLQHYYIFLWDYIDIIIMSAFVFGILGQFPLYYFIILFFIALFNRESSLFIVFFLFIQSFQLKPNLKLISKKHLFVSLSLFLINSVYIKAMRMLLYNGPERKDVYTGLPGILGNENHLMFNLKYFLYNFYYFFTKLGPDFNVVISAFIVFMVAFIIFCLIHGPPPLQRAALLLAAMVFSIFVSGLIMETRMWLMTLPFVCLMIAYIQSDHELLNKITLIKFISPKN